MCRVTQGHHQHLAVSFHFMEVFRRGLGSTNAGGFGLVCTVAKLTAQDLGKRRGMKAAESTHVIMNDVLTEGADTPLVSELVTATSDLPISRGVGPQATAEYEQNKLLRSPQDLTLLLMSGTSSCSE